MNHPIYANKHSLKLRETIESSAFSYEEREAFYVDLEQRAYSTSSDEAKESYYRLQEGWQIDDAIKENGFVLIDVSREDWESEISEKTIMGLSISEFKFPFLASTVKVKDGWISYRIIKDENEKPLLVAKWNSNGFVREGSFAMTEFPTIGDQITRGEEGMQSLLLSFFQYFFMCQFFQRTKSE